jgi:hypothetical protein
VSTPYTLSGSLIYPPDSGQPNATRSFSGSGNYDSKSEKDLVLTGAGTEVIDFGTVAKAKALVVEVASDAAAPVTFKLDGSADEHEISPGGFLAIGSPSPTAGITALSIVHTDDANVKVYILG